MQGARQAAGSALAVLVVLCLLAVRTTDAGNVLRRTAASHTTLSRVLSKDECQDVWRAIKGDIVQLRVDKDSPFSDKYHAVSPVFASSLMESIAFVMKQVHFELSLDEVVGSLDLVLPFGLFARASTYQSADFILAHFLTSDTIDPNALDEPIACTDIAIPPKLALLLTPFNTIQVPALCVFDALGDRAASLWYSRFYEFHTLALMRPESLKAMRAHQNSMVHLFKRWKYIDNTISSAYFGSSYVSADGSDSVVKLAINQVIQNAVIGTLNLDPNLSLDKCDSSTIVVVSQVWYPAHSVYRTFVKQLRQLAQQFKLVLLRFQASIPVDDSVFAEVITVPTTLDVLKRFQDAALRILEIKPAILFFPDIGMSVESVYLANQRLAPIQVASYGHSVSTYGSKVDFWIGSRDVELLSMVPQHYSEIPVLVDGLGITHTIPPFEPTRYGPLLDEKLARYGDAEAVVVNLAWAPMKTTTESIQMLNDILDHVDKHVVLRIFPGLNEDQLLKGLFTRDFATQLKRPRVSVEVLPLIVYDDYMSLLREGDLFLDSWPYGGCNTVMDALILNIPIVTRRGTRWHNRIGPAHLDLLGLTEWLVGESHHDYVRLAAQLVESAPLRRELAERIAASRPLASLAGDALTPRLFANAFGAMLANIDDWKARPHGDFIDLTA